MSEREPIRPRRLDPERAVEYLPLRIVPPAEELATADPFPELAEAATAIGKGAVLSRVERRARLAGRR